MRLCGTGSIRYDRNGVPFRALYRKEVPSGIAKTHGYLRWNGKRWALGDPPPVDTHTYQTIEFHVNGVLMTGIDAIEIEYRWP